MEFNTIEMNIYDQNFEFLMFDDAVEISIRQAKFLATLGSDITAIYFNHTLETNPFFDLYRVHKKEAEDDYIKNTPEFKKACDAIMELGRIMRELKDDGYLDPSNFKSGGYTCEKAVSIPFAKKTIAGRKLNSYI